MRIHGIVMATFYQTCIQTVINAILKNQENGQPKWPELDAEVETYTDAWKGISGGSQGDVGFSKTVLVRLMGC
jgi:hypothetical protein